MELAIGNRGQRIWRRTERRLVRRLDRIERRGHWLSRLGGLFLLASGVRLVFKQGFRGALFPILAGVGLLRRGFVRHRLVMFSRRPIGLLGEAERIFA
jgi:cytochrome b subunit of formate dehydrogenase